MTGYVRVSGTSIITGADITAGPLNSEFNKLRDAFSNDISKSHTHDGSTGNSTKIALSTSVSGYLPAVHGGTGGKNNYSATSLPTTTDDGTQGYALGSLWYNTTTNKLYVATSIVTSNAIWKEFSLGTSAGTTTLQNLTIDGTTNLNGSATNIGNADTDVITVVGTTTFQNNTTFGTANTDTMSIVATPTFTPQIIANGGLAGAVSGDVTGNVTGNISSSGSSSLNNVTLSGAITGGTIENSAIGGVTPSTITGTVVTANTNFAGNITGNVTGNVTASTGTSEFTNVTVNGNLNMNAGTTATITNLTAPTNNLDAATKKYVDDTKAEILGGASTAFDTLNEIETAIGSGSISGDLITMIGTKLAKSGGTMTANIVMSNSAEITGLPNTPTANSHATSKKYVDDILGSATNASDSATAAQTAQGLAESARDASIVAKNASESALTSFQSIYHGANATDPTGLSASDYGDLTFNTTTNTFKVYTSSGWVGIGVQTNATSNRFSYLANANGLQTTFTGADLAGNTLAFTGVYIDVYKNGVKQSLQNNDYSLSGGNTVTFPSALSASDVVEMVTFNAFTLASTSSLMPLTGGGFTGDVVFNGASANIQWDKSDNALEILNGAKIVIGSSDTVNDFHISSVGGTSAINTDNFQVYNQDGTQRLIQAGSNTSGVQLYHNNAPQIETNPTGARIKSSAQDATATLYLGTGSANIDADATYINLRGPSNHVGFRVSSGGMAAMVKGTTNVITVDDPEAAMVNGSLYIAQSSASTKATIAESVEDLAPHVSGNTLTWDASSATVFDLTLTNTAINTINISGLGAGSYAQGFTLRITQPSSGSSPSVTWPSTIKWKDGTAPTLTSTNSATDILSFVNIGGTYYGFVSALNVS